MLMIFLLILAQISLVIADTSYEIKTLPVTHYLFREINASISPDKIKNLQLATHEQVDSLTEEVKKSKALFDKKFFYRMDVVKFQLLDVGRTILSGKEVLPPEKLRTMPAGKYLIVNFNGPGSGINETFKRLPAIIKESGAIAENAVITYYKQSAVNSPSENIRILIKVKD